jgi:hypothetical protein
VALAGSGVIVDSGVHLSPLQSPRRRGGHVRSRGARRNPGLRAGAPTA